MQFKQRNCRDLRVSSRREPEGIWRCGSSGCDVCPWACVVRLTTRYAFHSLFHITACLDHTYCPRLISSLEWAKQSRCEKTNPDFTKFSISVEKKLLRHEDVVFVQWSAYLWGGGEETSRMGRMGTCSVSEAIEEAVMCCAQTDHITACFDRLPAHERQPIQERPAALIGSLHVRDNLYKRGQLLW